MHGSDADMLTSFQVNHTGGAKIALIYYDIIPGERIYFFRTTTSNDAREAPRRQRHISLWSLLDYASRWRNP